MFVTLTFDDIRLNQNDLVIKLFYFWVSLGIPGVCVGGEGGGAD